MKYSKQILEAINRGIKLALDDYEELVNGPIAPKKDIIKKDNSIREFANYINEFADLGLPSGTLWAKYNLGVNPNKLNEEGDWYGNYYAWAETEPKKEYLDVNYKYSKEYEGRIGYLVGSLIYLKYNKNDNKCLLDLDDDAANKFYDKFYTPTIELFEELLKYTDHNKQHYSVKDYLGIRGLNGRIFKSKINGEEIFFPYSGLMSGDGESFNISHKGYFMTSNIFPELYDYLGYDLEIEEFGICSVQHTSRRFGRAVRPVMMKK